MTEPGGVPGVTEPGDVPGAADPLGVTQPLCVTDPLGATNPQVIPGIRLHEPRPPPRTQRGLQDGIHPRRRIVVEHEPSVSLPVLVDPRAIRPRGEALLEPQCHADGVEPIPRNPCGSAKLLDRQMRRLIDQPLDGRHPCARQEARIEVGIPLDGRLTQAHADRLELRLADGTVTERVAQQLEPLRAPADVLGHPTRRRPAGPALAFAREDSRGIEQIAPCLHRPRDLAPASPGQRLQQLRRRAVPLPLRQPRDAQLSRRPRVDDTRRTRRQHVERIPRRGDLAHDPHDLAIIESSELSPLDQRDDALARPQEAIRQRTHFHRTNVRTKLDHHRPRGATPPDTDQDSPAATR